MDEDVRQEPSLPRVLRALCSTKSITPPFGKRAGTHARLARKQSNEGNSPGWVKQERPCRACHPYRLTCAQRPPSPKPLKMSIACHVHRRCTDRSQAPTGADHALYVFVCWAGATLIRLAAFRPVAALIHKPYTLTPLDRFSCFCRMSIFAISACTALLDVPSPSPGPLSSPTGASRASFGSGLGFRV